MKMKILLHEILFETTVRIKILRCRPKRFFTAENKHRRVQSANEFLRVYRPRNSLY